MRRTNVVVAGGLLALSLLATSARADVASEAEPSAVRSYTYVDLGWLGNNTYRLASEARDINGSGQVVGYSTTDTYTFRAFLRQGGTLRNLGAIYDTVSSSSYATAINDSGIVVGYTHVSSGEPPHAFVWSNGVMRDLGTGLRAGSFSAANDINSSGQIVGQGGASQSSPDRAVLWSDGTIRDLGTLGGRDTIPYGTDAIANAINDAGQIVGEAMPRGGPPWHGFVWQNGTMGDLGTLGGTTESTNAQDINNGGQVVGWSQNTSGDTHAFLWQDGVMSDIGTIGGRSSFAYGINEPGQVVGIARPAEDPYHNRAFLWENGVMVDLNQVVTNLPDDIVLVSAMAINDDGVIVGYTCRDTYECEPGKSVDGRAYLLIPNSP